MTGKELHDMIKEWVPETKEKDIKGTVACKGKAKGNVRVLLSAINIEQMKKGEILVAPATTPAYFTAMTKSAAIVTDEGGLTCHAAIVSRELGIPCIVGTGNATKVLKDGDLVEVDALNGFVKKVI